MKVIGTTTSGYLVELERREIPKIFGFRSYEEAESGGLNILKDFTQGYEHDLTRSNAAEDGIRNLDKRRIHNVRASINQMINELDKIQDNVDAVQLFSKLKE